MHDARPKGAEGQSMHAMQTAEARRLQTRILHLSSLLPRFLSSADGKHNFSPVLFDFRYFTDAATAEARVESSRQLQSLDEHMREVLVTLHTFLYVTVPFNVQQFNCRDTGSSLQDCGTCTAGPYCCSSKLSAT